MGGMEGQPGDGEDGLSRVNVRGSWLGPSLALISVVLCLAALEGAARAWVWLRWTPEELARVTEPVIAQSGYVGDSIFGYALEPGFSRVDAFGRRFTHDARGHRARPGEGSTSDAATRIVIAGASTVYGIYVDDDSTGSAQLEAVLRRRHPGERFEVFNFGVPGWTSRETIPRLAKEMETLRPDVVILIDGRNEMFPEAYNGFRVDYGHYRKLGWRLASANLGWKRLFRISHLAMLLLHDNSGRRLLGYSARDENPVYGYIRYENRPADLETLAWNLRQPHVGDTWKRNVRGLIERSRELGADVVLVEMPFRPDGYASAALPARSFDASRKDVLRVLQRRVVENNEILRQLARSERVGFVETDELIDPAYLRDDCHFNETGEARLAGLLADYLDAEVLSF